MEVLCFSRLIRLRTRFGRRFGLSAGRIGKGLRLLRIRLLRSWIGFMESMGLPTLKTFRI